MLVSVGVEKIYQFYFHSFRVFGETSGINAEMRQVMYDIIIIGAGTAGLTAALYGARAGKDVLVLEEKVAGGQIINSPAVENYPGIKHTSGLQFIQSLQQQAEAAGAKIQNVQAEKIVNQSEKKVVITKNSLYETRTVILCTGAAQRKLGLPGEQELTGCGVSYCAVCDGAFYRDKKVAVVGGGNSALEDALFLSNYCKKVFLIHRRDRFRGESQYVNALMQKSNVTFILETIVTALHGNNRLESLRIKNIQTNVIEELAVNAVFIAIGQEPRNEAFANTVLLDEQGFIRADESCRTNIPGIFAAGDCRTKKVRQLVTAAADGATAALAACEPQTNG